MPLIHRLPDTVVNRIAAGEVVEKPASVVKELVENSLDAGARAISVEVERGGLDLLRVVDDGCGMTPEDARLSLERHATSKITDDRDLAHLSTFGFRGEALPSILSVSRFALRTRARGAEVGLELASEGGGELRERPVAMPPGTEITVRDLFYNVPARLKFVKSDRTEASHVIDAVRALALAHPDRHFTLRSGGRLVLDLAPARDLNDRIADALGGEAAAWLFPVEHDGALRIRGAVGAPSLTRQSPSGLYWHVNGRWVRDRGIQRAVLNAYGPLLPHGAWPVAVLFLDLDPTQVDVNVHPAKAEVRFAASGAVFREVLGAVSGVLAGAPWVRADAPSAAYPVGGTPGEAALHQPPAAGYRLAPQPGGTSLRHTQLGLHSLDAPPGPDAQPEPAPGAQGYFSGLHYVGQVGGLFLVCETARELVLVDQHAAHERVTFEALRRGFALGEVPTQRLLLPERLELPADLMPILEERAADLASLGLHVRPFGGTSVVVEEVPAPLTGASCRALLIDLLDELRATESLGAFGLRVDALLSRAACHASVRGGDRLAPEAARALLASLDGVDFKANCPHGRPVVVGFSLDEVAGWFERT
jgi:DNA mismatch repair protein MutL